jgi:hypothetical protein
MRATVLDAVPEVLDPLGVGCILQLLEVLTVVMLREVQLLLDQQQVLLGLVLPLLPL